MKKLYSSNRIKTTLSGLTFLLFCFNSSFAQFSAGNITLLQIGNGVGTLTNTGNPLILKEYSPLGVPTFSMNVSSTGTNAIIISGAATSEGCLSLSPDGKYLSFGGYAAAIPNTFTASLSSYSSSVIPRGVGVVDKSANYNLAASSNSFFSGNNIRGAVTSGATNNIWGAGGTDGTDYFGTASTATLVQGTKANTRAIAIFNNQLYFSTQSASGTQTNLGVYQVGSGMPTASGATITNVINTATLSQPAQFFFNSTGSICYVADQRNAAGGGIQKWVLSGPSTYTLAYTLTTGTAAIGAFGVVAIFGSSGPPVVYATTTEASANRLIVIADLGASSTATTLATATANTLFKGLALSPSVVTGINEQANNKNPQINIYPNPVLDELNISISDKSATVEINDVTGKLIYETKMKSDITINTTQFQRGIYFVKIISENSIESKKFIKQ